jgi:UMF1 family MFS transporter
VTSLWLRRFALDRPESRAWALYDWANSAFWTTVIAAVFPVYYADELARGLPSATAAFRFQLATTLALIVIALAAPILGTMADVRAAKKRFFTFFVLLGGASTCALFFVGPGDWLAGLLLFALGNIGAAGSVVFYDAFLPLIARDEEADVLSSSGFALGYLGGGLMLALNCAWILAPGWFGFPTGPDADPTLPVRVGFAAVGLWWLGFTIPLWMRVKEPPRMLEPDETPGQSLWKVSFQRLRETVGELRLYRHALLMLVAALVYTDGILTIIRMASLYATDRGIDKTVVLGTLLAIQFVGIPCALVFGQLARRFGAKRMILCGLAVYACIPVLAFYMKGPAHFVALGVLVALVQGGTQALTRSLFAGMVPLHKTGEFFAFFSLAEKFAGVMGQALLTVLVLLTGSLQISILFVIGFFALGALLLSRVDVAAGQAAARAAERGVRVVETVPPA